MKEVIEQLLEIVEYLRDRDRFVAMGAKLPKGILLVGSPGTGKTLLARAIAGEANVPFFYCSGSEFDEIFAGLGTRRIKNMFEDAKKNAPCIIFIDEIDSLGSSRMKIPSYSTRDTTLNQFLVELDGFEDNSGVLVIGATNFPESLDIALSRPGRFDKTIHIPYPDKRSRKQILDYYLSKVKCSKDVDSEILARSTPGLSGADLANIVNTAALKAARRNATQVTMNLLNEAHDDAAMGIAKKSAGIPPENRKLTAFHESGHALVSLHIEGAHPIHKATIIPRGATLGMVAHRPEDDQYLLSQQQMMASIAIFMGGCAAEELVFGTDNVTTGASSDLEKATTIARSMVTKYGMSDRVGKIVRDTNAASPEIRQAIDLEIQRILNEQYEVASNILQQHRSELDQLAEALLEHETLTGEEIKLLLDGKPLKR